MSEAQWKPIETAPRDGSTVRVRREFEGRIVKEGDAQFGLRRDGAPGLQALGLDPLGRLGSADYAREAAALALSAATPQWVTADRMYLFPTPTHWLETAHG